MSKTLLNKIWFYAIMLVAIFPVLGIKLTSISIICFGVISLFVFFYEKDKKLSSQKTKWLLLFSSTYIIYLISTLFHPLNQEATFVLEKKMSLLIFPILILLTPLSISKTRFKQLLISFSFASILVVTYTNVLILFKGIPQKYLSIHDFSYSYRTFFNDLSGIHPTYISIYLAFSILVLIHFSLKTKRYLILYLAGIVIAVISLIPLAAKLPIIALVASTTLYLFTQPAVAKKIKIIFLGFIALMVAAIFTIPALNIRVNEVINASYKVPQGNNYTSIDVRTGIFNCSTAIIKDNYLFGVGPGNTQKELDNCYQNYTTNAFDVIHYNTHNEYFNILLSNGILGLLSFLFLLFTLTYLAFKYKLPLFSALMVLILLCFTTENLLDRQGGVVFFALFSALFTKYYLLQKK